MNPYQHQAGAPHRPTWCAPCDTAECPLSTSLQILPYLLNRHLDVANRHTDFEFPFLHLRLIWDRQQQCHLSSVT